MKFVEFSCQWLVLILTSIIPGCYQSATDIDDDPFSTDPETFAEPLASPFVSDDVRIIRDTDPGPDIVTVPPTPVMVDTGRPIDTAPLNRDTDTGPVHVPATCEGFYLAEDMYHSTGGAKDQGWSIWSDGYIETTHDFMGKKAQLIVVAKGDYAGDQWPLMEISVDGEVLSTLSVETGLWTEYEFDVPGGYGWVSLAVSFLNDYYYPGMGDRNLYVDTLSINCFD